MHDFDIIFACEGYGCTSQFSLHALRKSTKGLAITICPQCDRILELYLGESGGGNAYSYSRIHFEVRTLADHALRRIPAEVLRTIKEALRAFQANSTYACVAMCRRVVEGIVVTKGAQGRSLKDKIANLGNRQLISDRIEWRDQWVRSLGNIACHFDSIPENQITDLDAYVCVRTAYDVTKEVFLELDSENDDHRNWRI